MGLVTGDDRLAGTVADRLPASEYVTTKTARSSTAAVCRPQGEVRAEIREAATAAASDPPGEATPPVSVDPPVTVAVDYVRADFADTARLWPGVEAGDDSRTVVGEAEDVPAAYGFVRGAVKVRPGD